MMHDYIVFLRKGELKLWKVPAGGKTLAGVYRLVVDISRTGAKPIGFIRDFDGSPKVALKLFKNRLAIEGKDISKLKEPLIVSIN